MTELFKDVLRVIQSKGSATDNEIAEALSINLRTANDRRLALQRQGLISYAGMQTVGGKTRRMMWELTNKEVLHERMA